MKNLSLLMKMWHLWEELISAMVVGILMITQSMIRITYGKEPTITMRD